MIDSSHPFYIYFEKIYGPRWADLAKALQEPEKQVARVNLFSAQAQEKWTGQEFLPGLRAFRKEGLTPSRMQDELLDIYIMDPASLYAARALQVRPGERVLDMCAAPGGKTLVLAEALWASGSEGGELIANDLSEDRRDRLKKVIQQYVPRARRDHLWVHGKDAVQYGLREPESFDRVLLDAPCSGERHILENAAAFKEWSPRRTEHLATRQYSLLSAALLAVRKGGRIAYSTCSISPAENDGVIRKLLKKKKDQVRLLETEALPSEAEKTECGWQFLPDRCGYGPIYFSVLEKNASSLG